MTGLKLVYKVMREVPRELWEEYYNEMHPSWRAVENKIPENRLNLRGGFYAVAFRGLDAVGFASVQINAALKKGGTRSRFFDISPVFVSSKFRGVRVGANLLRQISYLAKKRDLDFMRVVESNSGMIRSIYKAQRILNRDKKFGQRVVVTHHPDSPSVDTFLSFGAKAQKRRR